MASNILCVFFLCLLSIALSLPIQESTNDISLKSLNVIRTELVLEPTVHKSLKRTKRNVIKKKGCAKHKIYFLRQCMSYERYEKLLSGDYDYDT